MAAGAPPSWNALTQHLRSQGLDDEVVFAAGVAGRAESGRLYDLMRGRIIFPVLDEHGEPRGLAGRQIVGNGPKYVNGPETSTPVDDGGRLAQAGAMTAMVTPSYHQRSEP